MITYTKHIHVTYICYQILMETRFTSTISSCGMRATLHWTCEYVQTYSCEL